MTLQTFIELQEQVEECLAAFESVKLEIRRQSPKLYERWHAGGCSVDDSFLSMYPALPKVLEDLESEVEEDEEDEDEGECPNYDAGVQCDCNSCTRQVAEKGAIA
jgi:hypothetical protein